MNEEEDARRRGVERLEQLIGTEEARAIMGTIPPFRWEELATKDDLARGFAGIHERFAGIEQRFVGIDERFVGIDERFAGIDQRFAAVDERLDAQREELTALRQEQRDGFVQLRDEMRERFALLQGLTQQTRTMVLLMAGTVAAVGALAIALAGLA